MNEAKIEHIEEEEDMRKLKYGEGSITMRQRKLKNGVVRRFFEGRIYINGKQISVYADTKKECIAKLCELKKDLRHEGQAMIRNGSAPLKALRTYNSWLDEWLKQFKEGKTRADYYDELVRRVDRVREVFGDRNIAKIEPLEILRYINSLPRCNSTVKTFDVINGSLQKAEDFGIIRRNPCRAIERPKYEQQNKRPYELSEQNAIMRSLNARYSAVFYFLCCTGLRIGEFLALTADDFDMDRHVIYVKSSKNSKSGNVNKPKTAAGVRKVYFNEDLLAGFDISTLGTYTYNAIKKAFKKALKQLNLTDISVTHSCRHTFASLLFAVGVNGKIIQRLMGHASITTTLDTYTDILMKGTSPIYEYISKLKSTLISTLI